MLASSNRVVFSDHEKSLEDENDRSSENRIIELLSDLQTSNAKKFSQNPIPFFPQVIFLYLHK